MNPEIARTARHRLEASLTHYRVTFSPVRCPETERARFPDMVGLYWRLTAGRERPPVEQARFAQSVADEMPQFDSEAVQARACRTWPSLVRQHHFELVLREHFGFVLASEALDYSGLDFLIVERGRAYGLALMVATKAAQRWADVKAHRHPRPTEFPVLELYAHPEEALQVGRLWLHPARQVEEIRAWMESSA